MNQSAYYTKRDSLEKYSSPNGTLEETAFLKKALWSTKRSLLQKYSSPNETQETRCESGLQPNAKEGVTI